MCDIDLYYRYIKTDESLKRLTKLKEYLEASFNLEAEIKEGTGYGPCYIFGCSATVELPVAEEIYQYCEEHYFAVSFFYRPFENTKYHLISD